MDNNTPKLKGYGTQQGASGTYNFNGIITQEEYNQTLVGMAARKVYDIMRRSDAAIHSALQALKLPIRSIDYTVEPASADDGAVTDADKEIAEFVEHELFNRNVNWSDFLREALSMFDFGFSVFEKTYEITQYNGKTYIGIKKIGSRKQRSILYWQTQDGKPGIQQQLLGTGIDARNGIISIDAERLIIFTNDKEGDNYEGISVLRFCFKDWDMKDKLGLVNAIALEKLAIGTPVLQVPADAQPDEVSKAEAIIAQMRANEESYVRIPVGWTLTMLNMEAGSTKDVLPTIEYHNHQIMLSVLAQFLMLGSGKGASGSRATSQDHSQLFLLSEEAAVKNFVETVQKQLIEQLCDLNFSSMPNGYPKLKSGRVADDDITALGTAMYQLASVGLLTPDPDLEQFIRQVIHAPDLSEEIIENYEEYGSGKVPLLPAGPVAPSATPPKSNPAPKPDTKAKSDPSLKPDAKTKASAISDARKARAQLIDILVRE